MKKILLLAAIVIVITGGKVTAQDTGGLGIRAGVNVANVTGSSVQAGFNVGLSWDIRLSRMIPLFLDTGLYAQYKGGKDISEGDLHKLELWYLELPALISYHIPVSKSMTIQPYAGLFYSVGLSGTVKVAGQDLNLNAFRNVLKRSDFGIRVGVGATYKILYFGVGYDAGMLNISKVNVENFRRPLRTGTFFVNVGVNF